MPSPSLVLPEQEYDSPAPLYLMRPACWPLPGALLVANYVPHAGLAMPRLLVDSAPCPLIRNDEKPDEVVAHETFTGAALRVW